MPSSPSLPEHLRPLLDAALAQPDASVRELAGATGLPKSSVHDALNRFGPARESLGRLKRDDFLAAWQQVGVKCLARLDELADRDPEAIQHVGEKSSIAAEIRNYAVAAGIASEKALLFAGQPTVIGAIAHSHRLALPELLDRVRQARAMLGSGEPDSGETGTADPSEGGV